MAMSPSVTGEGEADPALVVPAIVAHADVMALQ
jgi:hypothetical protein